MFEIHYITAYKQPNTKCKPQNIAKQQRIGQEINTKDYKAPNALIHTVENEKDDKI